MSDDLIPTAQAGDEAALRTLYENHRSRVMRLAFSFLGDVDEAEDVMQDVMVYALTNLDRYDSERAGFGTWLHTITVSRCRDRARRRRLGLRRITEWLRDRSALSETGPAEAIERVDAASSVGRALADLTELQREALLLRELEGLSFKEIGEVLGVPMRTAQTRVTAAYAALRAALGRTEVQLDNAPPAPRFDDTSPGLPVDNTPTEQRRDETPPRERLDDSGESGRG